MALKCRIVGIVAIQAHLIWASRPSQMSSGDALSSISIRAGSAALVFEEPRQKRRSKARGCTWEETTESGDKVECKDGSECDITTDVACCGVGNLAKCQKDHKACNGLAKDAVDFTCATDCAAHGGEKICDDEIQRDSAEKDLDSALESSGYFTKLGNGHCRTASGGEGIHEAPQEQDCETCEALCLSLTTCVAFDCRTVMASNDKHHCELKKETITKIEEDGNYECWTRKPEDTATGSVPTASLENTSNEEHVEALEKNAHRVQGRQIRSLVDWLKDSKKQWAELEKSINANEFVVLQDGSFGKVAAGCAADVIRGHTTAEESGEQHIKAPLCGVAGEVAEGEKVAVKCRGEVKEEAVDTIVPLKMLDELMVLVKPEVRGIGNHRGFISMPEEAEEYLDSLATHKLQGRTYPVQVFTDQTFTTFETAKHDLAWDQFTVLRRPITAEGAVLRISEQRKETLKKLEATIQKDLQGHLSQEFKKKLGIDEGADYAENQKVIIWFPASPEQKELKDMEGFVVGQPQMVDALRMYNIQITTESDKKGEIVLLEDDQFFPILSGQGNEPGENRLAHEVLICCGDQGESPSHNYKATVQFESESLRGRLAVITDVSFANGKYKYTASVPLAKDEQEHIQDISLFEDADGTSANFDDMETNAHIATGQQRARTRATLKAAEKHHDAHIRKVRTKLSPEELKAYEDALRKYHASKFPTDEDIEAHMASFKGKPEPEGEILGKRQGILKEMLDGLVPDIARSRMLAGGDDKVRGIHANVDDWTNKGLKVLGNSRGSVKFGDVVLKHLFNSHKQARSEDSFREKHIQHQANDLDETAKAMPNYGKV